MKTLTFALHLALCLPLAAAPEAAVGKPSLQETPMKPDRNRGVIILTAKDAVRSTADGAAEWSWQMKTQRWGRFRAALAYDSQLPETKVQLIVEKLSALKAAAPRTESEEKGNSLVLGEIELPAAGGQTVTLRAAGPPDAAHFQVRKIRFTPAPESAPPVQAESGMITLEARSATTHSEMMRYEDKPEKNCLGFWTLKEDWAEWVFEVNAPGEFDVMLHYGSGAGNQGSRAALLLGLQKVEFGIEDTGGFQKWRQLPLGKIRIETKGWNRLAIVPLELKGPALMDIQKIVLTPVPLGAGQEP